MQDETRVAVISMIIDNEESAASINALLHDCREVHHRQNGNSLP